MASNLKVDIVKPTATNGSLSLKGDSGGSATTNGISVDSSGDTSITGTATIATADINGGTIDGTTIGASSAAAGTFSSVTATTADINGGNIDGTTIGGTTPAAGSFTSVDATSASLDGAVTINDSGADVDFRVESNTNANALFVEGSSGMVGIGTTGLSTNGTRMSISGTGNLVRAITSGLGYVPFIFDKVDNSTSTSNAFAYFTINNQTAGSGQINANGALQAAFGSFSDRRLKKNIVDLPPQLNKILALRPVEFDYIESEGGGHQISFIAQEFEQVYPDAIGERPDGMKTLTGWDKTSARLVKAIQEQQTIIESQQAQIDALSARLDALENPAS